MGNPKATNDEIIEALKQSNAYEFISRNLLGINMNAGTAGT